jgi:PmbA protein
MSSTQVENLNPKIETDLREIAQDIVRRAMAGGATAAECVVREGDEFSTLVRLGQVETLKESGSKSIGVRVFFGQRAASTYSSDFSRAGLDRMVTSALALAKITSEDPFGGIPEASQLGQLSGDLDLYHEDVYSLPGADRIDYARRAEKAARDFDARMTRRQGTRFWRIRMGLWASTSGLTVLWRRCRLRRQRTAPCSAITGTPSRAR